MIRCEELFKDYMFDFDVENPIARLSAYIGTLVDAQQNPLQLNEDLKTILVTDKESLCIDYLVNRYDRIMSPLYMRTFEHYEENYGDTNLAIAKIIVMKFLFGWNKLADAMFSAYNPINNYDMKENRSTLLEEVTNTENEETVKNKYAGFNADEMKDVSESSTDGSIDTTKTTTGGKTNNELTRSGNIGVTTSQQMIESEYNLRKKNLLNLIYRDIDSILFIDYYN